MPLIVSNNPVNLELRDQLREEWIKALESGEYIQGQGNLHTVDDSGVHKYCCLGVACEIAVKHDIIPPAELYDGGPGPDDPPVPKGTTLPSRYRYDSSDMSFMPEKVAAAFGMFSRYGGVNGRGGPGTLYKLNDDGKTFSEIADLLRKGDYWNL